MSQENPFTLVFDALWDLLDSSQLVTSLVKPGNRLKFNLPNNRDPLKANALAGDLPEIILTSEGTSSINLHATSCTTQITRRYAWLISTGDMRINELLGPVEWAVFVSMLEWKTVLGSLRWLENSFVKRCNFVDVSNGLSDAERNRGIRGWSAVWRCEVEMHFNTNLLKSQLGGSSSGSA